MSWATYRAVAGPSLLRTIVFRAAISRAPAPQHGSWIPTQPCFSILASRSATVISDIMRQTLYGVKNWPFQWLPRFKPMNISPRKSWSGSSSRASTKRANSFGKICCSPWLYPLIARMYCFSRSSWVFPSRSKAFEMVIADIATKSAHTSQLLFL